MITHVAAAVRGPDAMPPLEPFAVILLALVSAAVIVAHCTALAELLDVSAFPPAVKRFWVGGLILLPIASCAVWFALPKDIRRGRSSRDLVQRPLDDQLTA